MKMSFKFIPQPMQSLLTLSIAAFISVGVQADPTKLPLATKKDLMGEYLGAFKINHDDDISKTTYSEGRIAYNPGRNSVYIDSNHKDDAIAEFAVPGALSKSNDVEDLPIAANMQSYRQVFPATNTGNTQKLDKIGGMYLIDGELFVQVYKTYDAGHDVTFTTAIVRDPNNLATSKVDGFFEMDGAARTAIYISPVPNEWQDLLGGPWIAGMGAGMSINSRFSEGPSLYTFDPAEVKSKTSGSISTNKHLDYPYNKALSTALYEGDGPGDWDQENKTGQNNLWNQLMNARYAFIIPNTRTYAVIGTAGGINSGAAYKGTNDLGYKCPGWCANDHDDYHTYYWLFDLNEILGADDTHDPLPYEYGVFDNRLMTYAESGVVGNIKGGSFDPVSGKLFLIKDHVGTLEPVVTVYQLNFTVAAAPNPPLAITAQKLP